MLAKQMPEGSSAISVWRWPGLGTTWPRNGSNWSVDTLNSVP